MCRLLVVVVAVFGIVPVMGGNVPQCNMTQVDESVNFIKAELGTILQDATIPPEHKIGQILQAVCNQTNIRAEVDNIAMMVAACSMQSQVNLSNTELASLQLGPMSFMDLLTNFQGVPHFCGCVPALLHVMSIEPMASKVNIPAENGDYPVMNVALLCDNSTDGMTLKTAVMYLDSKLQTCPSVFAYSTVLGVDNVGDMKMFAQESCANFNDTTFKCALNDSMEPAFKECITTANNDGTAEEKRCERYECVTKRVSCAGARNWYIRAVNMRKKNTFELTSCTTDTATSIVASVALILATLCSKLLL